jgi:GR25 family glycosyltransferase involved in LPS biosynthesis
MRFHSVPHSDACEFCSEPGRQSPLRQFVDSIYCISVEDEQFRADLASRHFHERGMCADVVFFRPAAAKRMAYGCWRSHQAVARHALDSGHRTVLILEDDVFLTARWRGAFRRAERAFRRLPDDWWGFFLGHRPLQAHFVDWGLLRARSMYAHAYVASERLLRWLAENEPMDPRIPMALEHGPAVDTAMANLPSMYALFPMIATQRFMGRLRVDVKRDEHGRRRGVLDIKRYGSEYFYRFHGMRLFEASALILSPYHALTLEKNRARSGRAFAADAALCATFFSGEYYLKKYPDVERAGIGALSHYMIAGAKNDNSPHPLFDSAFYRGRYPDVAASDAIPLVHFLKFGMDEGRTGHALFDPEWYGTAYSRQLGNCANLFKHFVEVGAFRGLNPNPFFDCAWYLENNPDVSAADRNPLEHYIAEGAKQGRKPSPSFDGERYLIRNPDVAASGMNPLEHYYRHGRAEGRSLEFAG